MYEPPLISLLRGNLQIVIRAYNAKNSVHTKLICSMSFRLILLCVETVPNML